MPPQRHSRVPTADDGDFESALASAFVGSFYEAGTQSTAALRPASCATPTRASSTPPASTQPAAARSARQIEMAERLRRLQEAEQQAEAKAVTAAHAKRPPPSWHEHQAPRRATATRRRGAAVLDGGDDDATGALGVALGYLRRWAGGRPPVVTCGIVLLSCTGALIFLFGGSLDSTSPQTSAAAMDGHSRWGVWPPPPPLSASAHRAWGGGAPVDSWVETKEHEHHEHFATKGTDDECAVFFSGELSDVRDWTYASCHDVRTKPDCATAYHIDFNGQKYSRSRLKLNAKLVESAHASIVHLSRWSGHRLRYFSLLRAEPPKPGKPLRGKVLVARGCKDCHSQGTVNGMDWFTTYIIGGLDEGGEAPTEVVHDYSMSHNMIIRPSSDGRHFYGMGGQDGGKMYGSGGKGPGYSSSAELREGVRIVAADSWSDVLGGAWLHPRHESSRAHADSATLAFNGRHDGCSDVHAQSNGRRCEFDGKMSLVEFRGRWLAYARSNMLNWGGRFVQVAATNGADPTGTFGKFQNIDIAGYDPKGPGNVYFGAVDVNPVDRETLMGLFPVNEGQKGSVNGNGDTYVGMAISCDGVHFSPFVKLIQSQGKEGRTYDQPVDGFAVDGEEVRFFVHLDVEHISPNADRQSRIEQYAFKADALRALTRGVRQALINCRPAN